MFAHSVCKGKEGVEDFLCGGDGGRGHGTHKCVLCRSCTHMCWVLGRTMLGAGSYHLLHMCTAPTDTHPSSSTGVFRAAGCHEQQTHVDTIAKHACPHPLVVVVPSPAVLRRIQRLDFVTSRHDVGNKGTYSDENAGGAA